MRRVGILGGMGPAATADFYTKLIEATPAARDQEHVPVVIWADPRVPDRSTALLNGGDDPTPALAEGVNALVDAGCDILAVACNTAHAFIVEAMGDAPIELVSIIDAAAEAAVDAGVATVGVMATAGTIATGLHADALTTRAIDVVSPTEGEQTVLTAVIAAVKAGTVDDAVRDDLAQVVAAMADRGADAVISACTELILALQGISTAVAIIDPAVAMAERVVAAARRDRDGPGQGRAATP